LFDVKGCQWYPRFALKAGRSRNKHKQTSRGQSSFRSELSGRGSTMLTNRGLVKRVVF